MAVLAAEAELEGVAGAGAGEKSPGKAGSEERVEDGLAGDEVDGEVVGAGMEGKEGGMVGVFGGGEGGDVSGGLAVKGVLRRVIVAVARDGEGLIGLGVGFGPTKEPAEEEKK